LSFSAITRVGVFCLISVLSALSSAALQRFAIVGDRFADVARDLDCFALRFDLAAMLVPR